jgi:hypothetical protein
MELTPQQYRWLMEGLSIHQKKTLQKIEDKIILCRPVTIEKYIVTGFF